MKYVITLIISFIVLISIANAQESTTLPVEPDWNLLSLPLSPSNNHKNFLFPSAVSSAFIYQNGYSSVDTLHHGKGFWIRFDSSETIPITGTHLSIDTIQVQTGWNIIGSLSSPITINSIQTIPPGIISSNYFDYKPGVGYQPTDTLKPGKGYWVKVTQSGTIILISVGPCPGTPTVTYAGKTYNTVLIGNQCWLKENLNVGTMIDSLQNQTDNNIIEKYCYRNDSANCNTYGGLYQWNEAMQYINSSGFQGICPDSWHIPTNEQIQTLLTGVNNNSNPLKAIGQGTGSGAGTNTSGFTALLSGVRIPDNQFYYINYLTLFWSSNKDLNVDTIAFNFQLWSDSWNTSRGFTNQNFGFSVRCLKDDVPQISMLSSPSNKTVDVTTPPILRWNTSVTATSYSLQVSTDSLFSNIIFNQSGLTDTSVQINILTYSTKYFWHVNATNSFGTSNWSPEWYFTTQNGPCPGTEIITYSGKTYNTVLIGTQCWLKENLNIGTMVPVSSSQTNDSTFEKYCYNEDTANCNLYGGLYQWNEAMQYSISLSAQGICPTGWHIPTNPDFQILGNSVQNDGNALKTAGQGIGNGAGTNISRFSALLTGSRSSDGAFNYLGTYSYSWSSTFHDTINSFYLNLASTDSGIYSNYTNQDYGLSVRCIKDDVTQPPILSSPRSGKTNINLPPTLYWYNKIGATSYTLQVSTDSLFSNIVYNQNGLVDTNQQLNGLDYATLYYWRVSTTNSYGSSNWSELWSFKTQPTPCPGIPIVLYEGKTYNTVLIGNQCWFRENLDVGTMIMGNTQSTDNGTIEKYCYNNDTANCNIYGGLYQWTEAMQYDTTIGAQSICPIGWHIPTFTEFQTLLSFVNYHANELKEVGQGAEAGIGTNTSGFSALMSGYCYPGNGSFSNIVNFMWTSTKFTLNNVTEAYPLMFLPNYNNVIFSSTYHINWDHGYNVRCLKDTAVTPQTPLLQSPTNGETNISVPPTLIWNASIGATSYTLQVSTDSLFSSLQFNQSGLVDTFKQVSGLKNTTRYFWRVQAINAHENSLYSTISWFFTDPGGLSNPCPSAPTVTYAGITYNTIRSGNQCWLKENLNVGAMIPSTTNQTNNSSIEKYCYNNDSLNCIMYGAFYKWNEAMQYSTTPGSQGICPTGWHIPTQTEFLTLKSAVSNSANALKANGQGTGAGIGTNTSGFSTLLSGYTFTDGTFDKFALNSILWSSTEFDASSVYEFSVVNNENNTYMNFDEKSYGFNIRCLKDIPENNPPNLPTAPSPANNEVGVSASPTLAWTCTDPENDSLTFDVYFDTVNPPLNKVSSSQSDTTLSRSGLNNNTTYYWKIVAKDNHNNTTTGSIWSFTTVVLSAPSCPGLPTVTYSGKTYNTVQIGTQCWLKENLDVGARIPTSTDQTNNDTIEKFCYNNDTANCNTYGGLYRWEEAMQYSMTAGSRGICPTGWHIPTRAQFETLGTTVSNSGNALKAIGQGSGAGTGTNTSGFSALIGGYVNYDGTSLEFNNLTNFWSSTGSGVENTLMRLDSSTNTITMIYWLSSGYAFHIRCLKD